MKPHKKFKLILLRHGNTFEAHETPYQVGSRTDLPLTEKGLSQARNFSEFLKISGKIPFAIYSGALKRQTTSAKILHDSFPDALLLTHRAALDEIDYGEWEKLTTPAICEQWSEEYEGWVKSGAWPNDIFKNSKEYHVNLLQNWLKSLENSVPDNSHIVAVSSNGIMRFILKCIPLLWDAVSKEGKMEEYKVRTGGYCELVYENGDWKIESWNTMPEAMVEDLKI